MNLQTEITKRLKTLGYTQQQINDLLKHGDNNLPELLRAIAKILESKQAVDRLVNTVTHT